MSTSRRKQKSDASPSSEPPSFSSLSTPQIPDSMFHSADFMLGAGIVIIQPSSGKIVIVESRGVWFLPKGRKDQGESLEQTALREGYEESGYRCEFFPLLFYSRAPRPPTMGPGDSLKVTEPLFTSIAAWGPRRINRGDSNYIDPGGEYLTFWYVGQIGPDAVREEHTGMPDEATYVGHLMTYEEVMHRLRGSLESHIVRVAWTTWQHTLAIDRMQVERQP